MEFIPEIGGIYGLQALNWTPPIVSWYHDQQLFAIIDGMASSLEGSTDGFLGNQGNGSQTIIGNTRFNPLYGKYPQENPPTTYNHLHGQAIRNASTNIPTPWNVTQDLLNQALFNITLSLITDFGWWNTNNTYVIIPKPLNIYTISRPLNIIIPYFLTLILAIPLLAIGAFALHKNGVSAVDGGFLQLVTTTTGSPTLEKLAARACIGGSESIPQDLKDLKIRFGELVGDDSEAKGDVRRAGFGTEDETILLTKGMLYGA